MTPTDQDVPSPEGLFRYQVVSEVLARTQGGEPQADAVAAVAGHEHLTCEGRVRHVGARTVYRWLAAFKRGGFPALLPAVRPHTESSLVLDAALLEFVEREKRGDPTASIPEVLRRARVLGLIAPDGRVDRTTVWRACGRMGLATRRTRKRRDRDTRRFAYPHRMQLVLCDGKHFRAGVGRLRRVALFFLDDATRKALLVVVGTSETHELFLRGLYRLVRRYGLMDVVYLDRGPGFIALDVIEVLRKLSVLLIHGKARYPEGRGKVEKFNQTALHQLLERLDGRPDVDADCGALELRLGHYIEQGYNLTPHESLDLETPQARFERDERPLRPAKSDEWLRSRFVVHFERRVSSDHVIPVGSRHYEVPRGHARQVVVVHHQLLDDTLSVLHEGRLVRLHEVDLAANARAARAAADSHTAADDETRPLTKSAADLAFQRDYQPVVDADGGLPQERD